MCDVFTFIIDVARFSLSATGYKFGESNIDVRIGVMFVHVVDTVAFDGEFIVVGIRLK